MAGISGADIGDLGYLYSKSKKGGCGEWKMKD